MSIKELLQPNPYDIFCNDLTAQNITFTGSNVASLTVGPPGPFSTVDSQILASNTVQVQPYSFSSNVPLGPNQALYRIINNDPACTDNSAAQLSIQLPGATPVAGNNYIVCSNQGAGNVFTVKSGGDILSSGGIITNGDIVSAAGNVSSFLDMTCLNLNALNNVNVSANVNCTGTVICTDGNVTNDLAVGNDCSVGGVLTINNLSATNITGTATLQSPAVGGFSANGGSFYGPLTLATSVPFNNDFIGNIIGFDVLNAMNNMQVYTPVPAMLKSASAVPAALPGTWGAVITDVVLATRSGQVGGTWFPAPADGITLMQDDNPKKSLLNISATIICDGPTVLNVSTVPTLAIRILSSLNNSICANQSAFDPQALTSTPPPYSGMTISCSCQYLAVATENFVVQAYQNIATTGLNLQSCILSIEYMGPA